MARERFARHAVSEEGFTAEYASLARNASPAITGRIALAVAVALRGYAQEPVWFAGFPAPTADQLEAAWGLEIRDILHSGPDHSRRPAEIFARSIEWFVAVTLAEQGRSNGYLTSIQDDVLTGYGSARPPDANGIAGTALVDVLDEVAPLDPANRNRYLARYGHPHRLTPYQQARHELDLRGGADCTM